MENDTKKIIGNTEFVINHHISSSLKPEQLPVQVIQTTFGSFRGAVRTSFFASSVKFSHSDLKETDIAVFNVKPATTGIADRMAERDRADLVGMDMDALDENYDGPGDEYYESSENYSRPTPEDMDRYKRLK